MIEKYRNQIDKTWVGLVTGLVGLFLGFIAIGIAWAILENSTLSFFIENAFIKTPMYRVRILTASVILDVLLFYIAFQKSMMNFAKGILSVMILAVLAIIILY